MASMKAKKGNPAERLIAYNLQLLGYDVIRPDDNSAGIDLIAEHSLARYYIEVKFHKKFSWNEIKKIYNKTANNIPKSDVYEHFPLFVFKSNQQPWLVAHSWQHNLEVIEFEEYFGGKIQSIPKGYKVWQKN